MRTVRRQDAASYNVRELLELERKLYQDSIDKNDRELRQVQDGTSEEYMLKCMPFENAREHELEVALVHFQLNKRNAFDLLEFELKQAEDVYQDDRASLKRQLVAACVDKRERILKRLRVLESGVQEPEVEEPEEPVLLAETGQVDAAMLSTILHDSQARNRATFSLNHLKYSLPSTAKVVAQVTQELEAVQERLQEPTRRGRAPIELEFHDEKMTIGDQHPFARGDAVVLWSRISDEEFLGDIENIAADKIELRLVCGTRVDVTTQRLRDGLCTLVHHSESVADVDEPQSASCDSTPKRPRRKTSGLRW